MRFTPNNSCWHKEIRLRYRASSSFFVAWLHSFCKWNAVLTYPPPPPPSNLDQLRHTPSVMLCVFVEQLQSIAFAYFSTVHPRRNKAFPCCCLNLPLKILCCSNLHQYLSLGEIPWRQYSAYLHLFFFLFLYIYLPFFYPSSLCSRFWPERKIGPNFIHWFHLTSLTRIHQLSIYMLAVFQTH